MIGYELIIAYKKPEKIEYLVKLFQRKTHLIASLNLKFLKNETDAENATYEVLEILSKDLLKHKTAHANPNSFSIYYFYNNTADFTYHASRPPSTKIFCPVK